MVANSLDPDQTPRCAASDQGLNCLLRLVCPNTMYLVQLLYTTDTFSPLPMLRFYLLFSYKIVISRSFQNGEGKVQGYKHCGK